LTYRALITAGWLAMISAFVSIPLTFVSYRLYDNADPTATTIQIAIQVAGALLFIGITLYFKKLLNSRFAFHDTDKSIVLMLVANVVASIIAIMALCFPLLKETFYFADLVILVFQGIVQMQFSYKLMKLQDDLDGMLKPFCYLNMATGICIASVVLIIVGIVVSSISDLMLGTIFFHVAKPEKEPDSSETDT